MANLIDTTENQGDRLTPLTATVLGQSMEPITVGTVVVLRVPDPAPIHPDGGQSRVVAVVAGLHEHEGRQWFNVLLCHSTWEMATDHDVFIHGVMPYTLVVMGELYAQAWADQVERVIGQAPVEPVQAAWRAVHDDGESAAAWNEAHSAYRLPMPLAGPIDPRWRWLEEWLPTATAVSSPVRRALIDGDV